MSVGLWRPSGIEKPASAPASGEVHSELDSAKARLFCQIVLNCTEKRVHCSPDKCDELKRALSALRSSKSHWKKKDWIEAVSLNIRTCDWGAVSHGGDRRSGGCQSHRCPGTTRGINFDMNASPTTISLWQCFGPCSIAMRCSLSASSSYSRICKARRSHSICMCQQ